MGETFGISIKTPEETLYQGSVSSVMVRTLDGTIFIGPGHADLVSSILDTEVVLSVGSEEKRYIGRDGFITFDNQKNEATIMLLWGGLVEDMHEHTISEYLDILKKELDAGVLNPTQVAYASRQQYASEKLIQIVRKEE